MGVARFFKQTGANAWWNGTGERPPFLYPGEVSPWGPVMWRLKLNKRTNRKGGDQNEMPVDLRIREVPRSITHDII
jgi:hypothetical protein